MAVDTPDLTCDQFVLLLAGTATSDDSRQKVDTCAAWSDLPEVTKTHQEPSLTSPSGGFFVTRSDEVGVGPSRSGKFSIIDVA
jgi:hypothetical protein